MTTQQSMLLKRAVALATFSAKPITIDAHCSLDDKMKQVALQCSASVENLTFQRLLTLLSEGFKVIMWDKWLGEEASLVIIEETIYDMVFVSRPAGAFFARYSVKHSDIYYKCFDLLDRHEQEVGDGIIVDTLVAPYLALVIPQGNS
jgi:hypothetical protein